jgi:RNase P/RNase MRP subunit POP5
MTNVTHKFLSMYLFLFLTLYMFRAHLTHQERQIVYTTSGNCHSVLVAVSCARHGHQHRVTVTRGYIDTICLS